MGQLAKAASPHGANGGDCTTQVCPTTLVWRLLSAPLGVNASAQSLAALCKCIQPLMQADSAVVFGADGKGNATVCPFMGEMSHLAPKGTAAPCPSGGTQHCQPS